MTEEEEFEFQLMYEKEMAQRASAPEKQQPVQQKPYDPYTFENIAGSAVEPLMTLASGAGASIAGGLSGLGTIAGNTLGMDLGNPAENVRKVQESLTYQPKSGGGQIATNFITYPLQKLGEFAKYGGEKQMEAFGSPELATGVETGINAIPMLFGVRGAKGLESRSNIPAVRYVGDKAARAKDFTVNAIRSRLPGGAEKTASKGVGEMIGEQRYPIVMDMLKKGKRGETAGQAASGSGSYELAALQKMAEQRLPSEYGAIKKNQIAGYDKLLEERFNADPGKLAIAKELLRKEAGRRYGKVRKEKIDPRSRAQIVEDLAKRADMLAEKSKSLKEKALQDWGNVKTTEAIQTKVPSTETLLKQLEDPNRPPMLKPQAGATRSMIGDIGQKPDISYATARTKAPTAFAKQEGPKILSPEEKAMTAANEIKSIARDRMLAEKAHTEIGNILRLNKRGLSETGMKDFLEKPSIQKAVREARLAAKEKGEYFPQSPDQPFSVGNLQRIKRAISESIETQKKSEKGLAKTKEAEMTNTVEAFNDWIRSRSEGFARTEDWYKQQIKPINQIEAGIKLREGLKPKLGEKVADRQFITTFEKMQKKGKLKDLTPEQIDAYATVKNALDRDVILKEQATAGSAAMNKTLGTMFDVPTVGILHRTVVIMNAIIKRVEGKNTDVALSTIAEKMKNPQEFANFLEKASPVERAKLNEAMTQARNQILAAGAIQTAEEQ